MEKEAGHVTLDPTLSSKSCILGLRSPVKLYDGLSATSAATSRVNCSRRVETAGARAACAALAARREMLKPVQVCEQTQMPSQENQSSHTLSVLNSPSHEVVGAILQPRNASLLPCSNMDRTHSRAVLAMQHRMSELCQELQYSKDMVDQSRQRFTQAEADYAQKLRKAEEAATAKIDFIQQQLAEQHLQQRHKSLLVSCSKAWVNLTKQRKQHRLGLQQAQSQLLRNHLRAWQAQMLLTRENKHQVQHQQARVLHAWQDHVYAVAAVQHKIQKVQHLRLKHILVDWVSRMQHKQRVSHQVTRAQWWYRHRLLNISLSRWWGVLLVKQVKAHDMAERLLKRCSREALQAWLQVATDGKPNSVHSQHPSGPQGQPPEHIVLRTALEQWQQYILQKVQCGYLQHRYQQVLLQRVWRVWAQLPSVSKRLKQIEGRLTPVGVQLQKRWGLQGFLQHTQEGKARWELQQMGLYRRLRAWRTVATRKARNRRLLQARAGRQALQMLCRCFSVWWRCSARAARLTAAARASNAHDTLAQQVARCTSAEAQAASAKEQLQLLVSHNQQLQQQVAAACAGALLSLQFMPALCWRSLPFDLDVPSLQPRARHAVFRLPALQQPVDQRARASNIQTAGHHAGLQLDVLLVYGGVCGDSWLTDLSMVILQETLGGHDCRITVMPLPCSGADSSEVKASEGAQQIHDSSPTCSSVSDEHSGPAGDEQLPRAVRDFAACACGQNQFVVSGGFDGKLDAIHLQLCVLEHREVHAGTQRHSVSRKQSTSPATHPGVNDWCQGWVAKWSLLQPRNPGPIGRCHHSMCYYAAGRSLVLFGGWTNRQGCLNDVWLFHQDHMEWWQPDATGEDVPCARRSHAAVVLDNSLFIYGGLSSDGHHLDDLWCLDMDRWQWQQAGLRDGVHPAGRRAAALELVDNRYLLLHGGYSGSQQLLHDTWVFDTHSNRWLMVDVTVPASELPVPRALHSLTCLGQKFVVIGGVGPAGPVPDVHLLECPAVTRGLQLQQQCLDSQTQLVHSRQRSAQMYAEVVSGRTELQERNRQLQALNARFVQLSKQHAAAAQDSSTMQTRLLSAQQAASTAAQQAQAAQQSVAVLERRLVRARQGGNRAVEAAQQTGKQVQQAEQVIHVLRQQLLDQQRRLQQQQVSLIQHKAEAAVLQSELQECKLHMKLTTAARDSAHTDLTAALERKDELYAQELQHLHSLLQDARQAQKTLADELLTLQAQAAVPAAATAPHVLATAASALPRAADTPSAASVSDCELSSGAKGSQGGNQDSGNLEAGKDGLLQCASSSVAASVSAGDQCVVAGATTSLRTGDELAAMHSKRDEAREQLEALQQKTRLQEEELALMKQQLHLEHLTAVAAQQAQQAAVFTLHQLEEQYHQQVQDLEQQMQSHRWQQWRTAGETVAHEAETGHGRRSQGLLVLSHNQRSSSSHNCGSKHSTAGSTTSAADSAAVAEHVAEQLQQLAACHPGKSRADADAACMPSRSTAMDQFCGSNNTPSGLVTTAVVNHAPDKVDYTVSLLPANIVGGELEMLPEVVKLMDLHRKLMAGE